MVDKNSKTVEPIDAKYVFMDVVGYARDRTIEDQTHITEVLNEIVKTAIYSLTLDDEDLIYIPTGDGICIALLGVLEPFDVHVQLALTILAGVSSYNETTDKKRRQFEIRIGVNENVDNVVIDINGKRNVTGKGINFAQRIMDAGDGGNLLMGQSVFEKLSQREHYVDRLDSYTVTIKHGASLPVHQLKDHGLAGLNSDVPEMIAARLAASTSGPRIPALSESAAYLLGFCIKHAEFVKTAHGNAGQDFSIFTMVSVMADDRVRAKKPIGLDQQDSHLPDVSGVELIDYFGRYYGSTYWLIVDYGNMYRDLHFPGSMQYEYFEPVTNYLQISRKGREALQREWPSIVDELQIAEQI